MLTIHTLIVTVMFHDHVRPHAKMFHDVFSIYRAVMFHVKHDVVSTKIKKACFT